MSRSRVERDRASDNAVDGHGARERILAAATRLFQESGYEGTSVSRIAKAADMTPANMYWHFPSKQEVLAEVLSSMYRRSYEELASAVPAGGAVERLSAYVRAYVRIQLTEVGEHRNFGYASLASALPPEGQDEVNRVGRPYLELLREILRQGVAEGEFEIDDLKVTSYAISTTCEYVFTWCRADGPLPFDEVGENYVRLILRMVRRTR
ncbi:TetR/AcrR family transcriptional regulator [Streptomyces sp. NPDC005811]|uniref:TetR/AcrR family transcriptional regulator n=1 Tax=Streptomyces sp. NPDC005811 TaxID=3154565 RepID=UPI00340D2D63